MATTPSFIRNRGITQGDQVTRQERAGVRFVPEADAFTYDASQDEDLFGDDGLKAIESELNEYLGTIETAAKDLIRRNRANDAQSLRTLGDRLKNIANQRGVTSEQIARQMNDVTNKVNASQGLFESKVMNDKLSKLSQAISQKADIQRQLFNQGMDRAQFRERVLKNMEGSQMPRSPISSSTYNRRSGAGNRAQDRISPVAARDNTARRIALRNADDFRKKQDIAASIENRDRNLAARNPLFTPGGPQSAMAQAGLAVTQANMGVTPGLFRSGGPSAVGRAGVTDAQTTGAIRRAPTQQSFIQAADVNVGAGNPTYGKSSVPRSPLRQDTQFVYGPQGGVLVDKNREYLGHIVKGRRKK